MIWLWRQRASQCRSKSHKAPWMQAKSRAEADVQHVRETLQGELHQALQRAEREAQHCAGVVAESEAAAAAHAQHAQHAQKDISALTSAMEELTSALTAAQQAAAAAEASLEQERSRSASKLRYPFSAL